MKRFVLFLVAAAALMFNISSFAHTQPQVVYAPRALAAPINPYPPAQAVFLAPGMTYYRPSYYPQVVAYPQYGYAPRVSITISGGNRNASGSVQLNLP